MLNALIQFKIIQYWWWFWRQWCRDVALGIDPTTCHSVSQQPTTCHSVSQQPTTCHSVSQQPTTCHSVSQQPITCQSVSQQPTTCQIITRFSRSHKWEGKMTQLQTPTNFLFESKIDPLGQQEDKEGSYTLEKPFSPTSLVTLSMCSNKTYFLSVSIQLPFTFQLSLNVICAAAIWNRDLGQNCNYCVLKKKENQIRFRYCSTGLVSFILGQLDCKVLQSSTFICNIAISVTSSLDTGFMVSYLSLRNIFLSLQ